MEKKGDWQTWEQFEANRSVKHRVLWKELDLMLTSVRSGVVSDKSLIVLNSPLVTWDHVHLENFHLFHYWILLETFKIALPGIGFKLIVTTTNRCFVILYRAPDKYRATSFPTFDTFLLVSAEISVIWDVAALAISMCLIWILNVSGSGGLNRTI